MYLAVTLDLHSRAVVGYAMDVQMPATLPLAALQMAAGRRCPPPGLLHHSDQGSQYASRIFQEELARMRARGSMSRKGDCWDNAVVESFFSSLKRELFKDAIFESRAATRHAVFESTLSLLQPPASPLNSRVLDAPGVRTPSYRCLTSTTHNRGRPTCR